MNALAHIPGYLRAGPLRVPVFGLFAAAGLVCALWLSQRTARLAALSPDRLWNAGLFAVIAAFVASRILLFAMDPAGFLRYPLLILEMPSLTYGGVALTAVFTWLWLRAKRMPALNVADAWAPCGALLWAFLSQGHFVEGTDAGMPTQLPWGIVTPGDTVLGRVHPVQEYTLAAALALCLFLLRGLKRRHRVGEVAASGLFLGGALSFLLDMLRQPVDTAGDFWLDPSQWVAVAVMLIGAALTTLFRLPPVPTRSEVAEFLEEFVDHRGRIPVVLLRDAIFTDPLLREVRTRFMTLPRDYPSSDHAWCDREGLEVISWYLPQLRGDQPAESEKV